MSLFSEPRRKRQIFHIPSASRLSPVFARRCVPRPFAIQRLFRLSFGRDNTSLKLPFVDYTPMRMGEFAIFARVLEVAPSAPGNPDKSAGV